MAVQFEKGPEETSESLSRHELEAREAGEPIDVDLANLYAPNSKYTADQKVSAVMAFITTGSSRKASKVCGINETVIRDWKTRSSWWPEVYAECKKKKQEELDGAITDIIHRSVGHLLDRLEEGDTKIDRNGRPHQAPLSGRDVAWIMAVLFDKRQLIRGEATSRSEKVSEDDRLSKLQAQFEKMATEVHGYNAKTIDGEKVEQEQES